MDGAGVQAPASFISFEQKGRMNMGTVVLNAIIKYLEANPALLEELIQALVSQLIPALTAHVQAQAAAPKQ
jgi:hypothetical protein